MNFSAMSEVLDELYEFISSDSSLHAYAARVLIVREDARALAVGRRFVRPLNIEPTEPFPSRALAEKAIEILNKLPRIDPEGDDREAVRLAAQLRGNLAVAFTHAIISAYPDLVG